jgi:hypothetical protein
MSFVLVGNLILGIHNMTLAYWLVLFSVAFFSNLLGLNISSAFDSVVTIYILNAIAADTPDTPLRGNMKFDDLQNKTADKDAVLLSATLWFPAGLLRQWLSNSTRTTVIWPIL